MVLMKWPRECQDHGKSIMVDRPLWILACSPSTHVTTMDNPYNQTVSPFKSNVIQNAHAHESWPADIAVASLSAMMEVVVVPSFIRNGEFGLMPCRNMWGSGSLGSMRFQTTQQQSCI